MVYGDNHPDRKHRRKWPRLYQLLTSELDMQQVADRSGLSLSQLRRLMRDEEFTASFEQYRDASITASIAKAAYALSAGTTKMLDILLSYDSSDAVKVQAYKAITDYALKAIEMTSVTNRLSDLEDMLKQNGDDSEAF